MTSTHLFFNNVFAETNPNLIDLEESFANLRINYMPNSIINKNEEIVDEVEVSHSEMEESHDEAEEENDHQIETLSKEQIKIFENIYYKNKIVDDEQIIDSEEQMEIDHDIEHYVANLLKRIATEKDIYLKGILSICRIAFMGIYGIGKRRWKNIRSHYNDFDIQPRTHSLMGKVSNRAISFDGVLQIIRKFKKDTKPIIFFPADENHTTVFKYFIDAVEENSEICISNKTFQKIWHTYLPEIKFLTPRSDLCHTCKEHRFNANYWMLGEKEVKVKKWNDHITWAMKECEYYRY
nr:12038_t:CDS:2 [Entrophospora candida]